MPYVLSEEQKKKKKEYAIAYRKKQDYSKGKIYKIVADNGVYVGSTKNRLTWRIWKHRNDKKKGIVNSSGKLNLDTAEIILLENYPCESKIQLNEREQYWIDQYDCVNKIRASPDTYENLLEKEKLAKRDRRKFKSSWAFNNNIYGFRLCLLDIDPTLFQ
tara:strand:+ start:45 stop:524 length:480 start_codon:yes stop_codon:yes gene_type:complete